METILIVILFTFIGWQLREYVARRHIKRIVDQVESSIDEQEDERIRIDIEKYNDMFLVYDQETGAFMAQGKDGQEISKRLAERYPHKIFAASEEDLSKVGLL